MRWSAAPLLIGVVAVAHVTPAAAEEVMPSPPPSAATATTPTTTQERVELVPTNERLVITYRWPRWVPWTVLGSAVAVGGLGVLVQFSAEDMMNQYDQRVASSCAVNGCNFEDPQTPAEQALVDDLNATRESAERRDRIGFVMILGASAALVTGVVLVVLNRPQRHVLKMDLVPAPGGATATVGWHF
jgi:hypothetical protein